MVGRGFKSDMVKDEIISFLKFCLIHHTIGVMICDSATLCSKSSLHFVRNIMTLIYLQEIVDPYFVPLIGTLTHPIFQQENVPHNDFEMDYSDMVGKSPRSPHLSSKTFLFISFIYKIQ